MNKQEPYKTNNEQKLPAKKLQIYEKHKLLNAQIIDCWLQATINYHEITKEKGKLNKYKVRDIGDICKEKYQITKEFCFQNMLEC